MIKYRRNKVNICQHLSSCQTSDADVRFFSEFVCKQQVYSSQWGRQMTMKPIKLQSAFCCYDSFAPHNCELFSGLSSKMMKKYLLKMSHGDPGYSCQPGSESSDMLLQEFSCSD